MQKIAGFSCACPRAVRAGSRDGLINFWNNKGSYITSRSSRETLTLFLTYEAEGTAGTLRRPALSFIDSFSVSSAFFSRGN